MARFVKVAGAFHPPGSCNFFHAVTAVIVVNDTDVHVVDLFVLVVLLPIPRGIAVR